MISKEEILVALIKSGYLLEDRVNKALTTNGWLTVPNMRYIDDQTGIEREIDIMALNHISMGNNYADYIHSSLLIECMNNKEPIVFFENLEKSTNRIAALSFTCFNNNFWEILLMAQTEIGFSEELIWSSQYCSFQQVKNKEAENNGWIAYHPNDNHDSLNTFFKFIKFHKNAYSERKNSADFIVGFYHRPLIILQGPLMSVEQGNDIKIHERNHIKYQIPKTENDGRLFTIDIITEDFLDSYLKDIKKEDEIIGDMIRRSREKLID